MAKQTTPEEIQILLKSVITHFDQEDRAVRERQIRTGRRLKLFWENFHRAWYSEVAHDWRIWDADATGSDSDQSAYDKPVNVFRAYLESIIAALSVTVPPIKCYPDDADNTLDLSTARCGDRITKLIYRHNNVSLLWLHSLFVYCTEGMVACYNYPKSDKKYGTYENKKYEDTEEVHQYARCPDCGYNIQDTVLPGPNGSPEGIPPEAKQQIDSKLEQYEDEFNPGNVEIQDLAQGDTDFCPVCDAEIIPQILQETLIVTRLVGVTNDPKTRMCLESYGYLNIKIPNYARTQEECPYLMYSYEEHYSAAIEKYDHLFNKKSSLTRDKIAALTGPRDPYEEWGRLSPQYQGEYPMNTVTIGMKWLRPCAFNVLDEDDAKKLKKRYPNGVKVVMVNDCFAEACNEALDDCWTIIRNPLSDYIHYDPLGLLLTSIQEITNDLISLTLQTIEHGIGQTFADPGVLDFNAYRQMETTPGAVYEAKAKSGQTLRDSFHEMSTAQLSPEVMPFAQNIQSMGQLVSGALPSLFGGALEGSETASQYSMSRAQALQRLQNTWKMFTSWWKEIFGKVIPMYIEETKGEGDDRDVQRLKDGSFINVFIRRAELEGKIGKIELEANENLPLTWGQVKDVVMSLLESGSPEILQILGAPENLPIIREAIGLDNFFVPGEDVVEKTYDDIKLLLNSTPIPNPMIPPDPMTGEPMAPEMIEQMGVPPESASIEVDPDYDTPDIGFEIVRKWVVSEAGRVAKTDNPDGYRNVLLYGRALKQLGMMQAMQSMPPEDGENGAPPKKGSGPSNSQAPITGESNVQTQS